MRKSIAYHTRLCSDGSKIVGGTFGGAIDADTIERITRAHFSVIVKPSGRAVFVDNGGREVCLYFNIDPEYCEKGRAALSEYRAKKAKEAREEEARAAAQAAEIAELMEGMPFDEIIARLGGNIEE